METETCLDYINAERITVQISADFIDVFISFDSEEHLDKFNELYDETLVDQYLVERITADYEMSDPPIPVPEFSHLRWDDTRDRMRGIYAADARYDIIKS